MHTITVEERITEEYHCDVAALLETYANDGLTSKQVARKLDCGVSNVRRIARKYNIRFNQPAPQVTIRQSQEFQAPKMNPINFLSRTWHTNKKSVHRVAELA